MHSCRQGQRMASGEHRGAFHIGSGERNLSIIVHSLFSAWMLAFLFEGQILYSLAATYSLPPAALIFGGTAAILAGLFSFGFLIRTKRAAKQLFLFSYTVFIAVSILFFFPPSALWNIGIVASSFLAGGCVAAWGFYFKSSTQKNERTKMAADMLICSNILMILLNMVAIFFSPYVGLALSMFMLLGAFLLALWLPTDQNAESPTTFERKESPTNIAGLLAFLCLFIALISITSGLMYQVINPAFAHLNWLTNWYWALPYIAALFIMRNLPGRINRTYILYIAIAMIGLSFIGFMSLGRSVASYFVVNTLMLGAFGVYDLFWWSILGEMLEFHRNPAKILGIGLSANVLGVLLGGLIGNAVTSAHLQSINPTLLALAVVCIALAVLPPLHNHLSSLLEDHAHLSVFFELPPLERARTTGRLFERAHISERESQVASMLLQKKTYKEIASELVISENTVKYYVKNIYSKLNIQSRSELIQMALTNED